MVSDDDDDAYTELLLENRDEIDSLWQGYDEFPELFWATYNNLDLDEVVTLRSGAHGLLADGKFEAAEPKFMKAINILETAELKLQEERNDTIRNLCKQIETIPSLTLTDTHRIIIANDLYKNVEHDVRKQLSEMKESLTETQRGFKKWGPEKPIDARYEEMLKKRRSLLWRLYRVYIVTISIGVVVGWLLSTISIWLIVIPVIIAYFVIAPVALQTALALDNLDFSRELSDYGKSRGKKS
jgi:hypothetical protein